MKRINWFPLLVIIAIASAVAIVWFLQTISNNTSVSLGKKFSQTILPKSEIQNENDIETVWPDPETIDSEIIESLSPEIREKISQSPVPVLLPYNLSDYVIDGITVQEDGYSIQIRNDIAVISINGYKLKDEMMIESDSPVIDGPYVSATLWGASGSWFNDQGTISYAILFSCNTENCKAVQQTKNLIQGLSYIGGKGN